MARTVTVCDPFVVGVHDTSYGAVSSLSINVGPSKNSTLATRPSSLAPAVSATVPDTFAPAPWLDSATDGLTTTPRALAGSSYCTSSIGRWLTVAASSL